MNNEPKPKPTPLDVINGSSRWGLAHGETLKTLRELPDDSVDALITDPPYSSGGQYRGDRLGSTDEKYTQHGFQGRRSDFAGDTRDQRSFTYWETLWLSECLRILKPGAPFCVFTDWRQLPATTDAVQAGGLVWRGIVPWDKTEKCRPRMGGFRSQSEFLVWGTKGPTDNEAAAAVGVLPGLFRVPVNHDDKHHQTGKPTELMRQVCAICPPGGIILDPFAGSGTTLVGALLTGRRAIGFEIVEGYSNTAADRCAATLIDGDFRTPEQRTLFEDLAK